MLMIIKKIGFYLFICKCKLIFTDISYNFKFNEMYNIHPHYFHRKNLITKFDFFMRYGHKNSHISGMNFTFVTNLNCVTYEHYLKQSKSMLEGRD